MKKLALLLVISFTAVSVSATEPLILEPLSPEVLYGTNVSPVQQTTYTTDENGVQVSVPGQPDVQASYTPKLGDNMVPQNAAAEGKPVPQKRTPRVRIQTKQRSQGNAYWNAGGKGTKSFF